MVLVIMVLMSGVVAAALAPALADARLRAGTRQVLSALRAARDQAVTQRAPAAVVFDPARPGVAVYTTATDDTDDTGWRPLTTSAGRFRALPAGVTVADITRPDGSVLATEDSSQPPGAGPGGENTTALTFTALGQGEDAAITLQDAHGQQRVIQVDALTGRADLAETTP